MSANFTPISYAKRWIFFGLATIILHLGVLNWASQHLTRPSELKTFDAGNNIVVNLARPKATGPKPGVESKVPPEPGPEPQPKAKSISPRKVPPKPMAAPEVASATDPVSEALPESSPTPEPSPSPNAEPPAADPVVNAPAQQDSYRFDLLPSMEIKYAVRKSNRVDEKEHPTTGRGAIRFLNRAGEYRIEGEFKFLFFTFFSFTSEGSVDKFGLAPALYAEKRGTRALTNTHFQRGKKIISFSASTQQYPLADGAQDRASILWQLAAIAKVEAKNFSSNTVIDIFVAGDRRADLWSFQVKDSDSIRLDGRDIAALHLVQQPPEGSYERRIDVWLAPQYDWAPVKIVYTEANGNLLEMEMTSVIALSSAEK